MTAYGAAVHVRSMHEPDDLHDAAELFRAVWDAAPAAAPMAPQLLRALAHSGNYVAAAFDGDRMVGASAGFVTVGASNADRTDASVPAGNADARTERQPPSPLTRREHGVAGPGTTTPPGALHSHITGVPAEHRGRGIGRALKHHQREWALARHIPVVVWTFDPLVRRNARFNLTALGATASSYLPDFYGAIDDAVNGGDETDRCEVVWDLVSDRVRRAVSAGRGGSGAPDVDALRRAGAVTILGPADHAPLDGGPAPTRANTRGASRTTSGGPARPEPLVHPLDGEIRLCWVPPDIVALRREDRRLARAWRLALRETLGRSLADGFTATRISDDGWYVLERPTTPP